MILNCNIWLLGYRLPSWGNDWYTKGEAVGCPAEEIIGIQKGWDIFIVPKASTGSGAHLVFSYSMSTRDILPGDKVAEAWDWSSSMSSEKVKNEYSDTFTLPLCLYGAHRDHFSSYLFYNDSYTCWQFVTQNLTFHYICNYEFSPFYLVTLVEMYYNTDVLVAQSL